MAEESRESINEEFYNIVDTFKPADFNDNISHTMAEILSMNNNIIIEITNIDSEGFNKRNRRKLDKVARRCANFFCKKLIAVLKNEPDTSIHSMIVVAMLSECNDARVAMLNDLMATDDFFRYGQSNVDDILADLEDVKLMQKTCRPRDIALYARNVYYRDLSSDVELFEEKLTDLGF